MLVFENKGLVPMEAFTTFGMSAKPGSTNPIGKFGTGLKYAVAVTLRLGGTFKLWRGGTEYEFYTKEEDFRGKTFAKVRMRKRHTFLSRWQYTGLPFTTELGKHWEPWMAMRELEANCRDEGGNSYLVNEPFDNGVDVPIEGYTAVIIECPEIEEAYKNIETVFLSPDKTLLYENSDLYVYEGKSDYMFYRGMRIRKLTKPSLYTYELKHVDLTEDRVTSHPWWDDSRITSGLLGCDDKTIVNNVVTKSSDYHEGDFNWDQKRPGSDLSPAWRGALSVSGLGSRFSAMRDNYYVGLAGHEDVDITFSVEEWLRIVEYVPDDLGARIKDALTDAGWKENKEEMEDDTEA